VWLYLVRRLGLALAIVAVAVTVLFSMIHMVPGDPASVMLGPRATPELREALRLRLGLDQPFVVQIGSFFLSVLRGDLGTDIVRDQPVADIVLRQLPYTVVLVLAAIGWAALVGIPLGCFSALYRNSLADKLVAVLSVSFIAIPYFVVSIYALLLFAVTLRWFPAIGVGEPGDLASQARHLVLPAFAVGLSWVGYIARMVRASMIEVLGENHVRTARAFGLSEWRIVFSYALPIAVLPTVTILGVGIGYLLSSAVFAEIVFSRPGIGSLIYEAVGQCNYPVVMGGVLITTVLLVVSTTLADLINAALDPRMREKL
jgi:peptide/nickel transport system permease protein